MKYNRSNSIVLTQYSYIAFLGNIANNFYRESKELRKGNFPNIHLFYCDLHETYRPEHDDPQLLNYKPNWVNQLDKPSLKDSIFLILGFPNLCSVNTRKLIKTLDSFDIILISGFELIFIPSLKTLTVFRVTGGDFTINAFVLKSLFYYFSTTSLIKRINIFSILKLLLKTGITKKCLKKSSFLSFRETSKPYILSAKKLKIDSNKILPGRRLAIDTSRFLIMDPALKSRDKFIIFFPPRLVFSQSRVMRETGQWKGAQIALEGISLFMSDLDYKEFNNIEIRIPKVTFSNQRSKAIKLIRKLELQHNTTWVEPDFSQSLSRDKMITEYQKSHAVLDDFGAGWYGSVLVEALACGANVVSNVSKEIIDEFPWVPFLVARDPEQISIELRKLFEGFRNGRDLINYNGREWVKTFHTGNYTNHEMSKFLEAVNQRLKN
jgi:hypothetical protein